MRDDSALGLAAGSVADAALSGLLQPRKTLPAKLFYDEEGCRLFGRITELPEYYLTRTERSLLADVAPRVAALVGGPAVLVEYGASDEAKAEFLLREGAFRAYVPIDVAEPQLEQMRLRLREKRPDLQVCVVPADFMDVVALPTQLPSLPRLGFFPGSTIGNLDPMDALHFLERARGALGHDSWFLVGVDLRKDPTILLPAYDDAAGRHGGVQSQSVGAAQSRGGRRLRSKRFCAPRGVERSGEPDRDAPGKPARSDGACRGPGNPLHLAARRFTQRTATNTHQSTLRNSPRRLGGMAWSCGAIRRDCSHCICWNRDAGPEARVGCITPRQPSARLTNRHATAAVRDARGSSVSR